MRISPKIAAAGLAAALALAGAPAGATSVEPMTLTTLARRADAVVHARVAKTVTTWGQHLERPAIVTQVLLEREEALAGAAPRALQLFGGQVGDLRMTLHGQPVLAAGDEVVLFLHAGAVECPFVGVWQGVYHLRDGRAFREGRPVVDVVDGEPCLGHDGEAPMTAAAFLDEVRAALAAATAAPPAEAPSAAACGACPEGR